MAIYRVFSGDYDCPRCGIEFRAERAFEIELTCPTCKAKLEEIVDPPTRRAADGAIMAASCNVPERAGSQP